MMYNYLKFGPKNALERKQKVFMEPNGVFECQRIDNDIKCHCESHLDNMDICLNRLCISEKFGVDKKSKSCDISKGYSQKKPSQKVRGSF